MVCNLCILLSIWATRDKSMRGGAILSITPPSLQGSVVCVCLEKFAGYTVLKCNLHGEPARHCAGFWAEHVLRCDFMSSIPHSTLLDLPGGATLYSLLNFILSFIVFLIKPAHWPLVEWNLQDRWTLNICFFPQQRDPLAHLKNANLSYKSNSLLLSICICVCVCVCICVCVCCFCSWK